MNVITEEIVAGPWDVHRDVYHADRTCVSSSSLKDYTFSVPYYQARHVAGVVPPSESTVDQDIGTATHILWLEPHKFDQEVAVGPECDRRSNANKATWAAFEALHAGKIILAAKQHSQVQAMAAALSAHPQASVANKLYGPVERPIRWQDVCTGIWCRAMLDKLIPVMPTGMNMRPLIVDLKTTSGPVSQWSFGKTAFEFSYHRQAAFYVEGARRALDLDCDMMFVVVSKDDRWHEVACHVLTQRALELGRDENQRDLEEIDDRRRTGDWSSRHAVSVYETDLPSYAYNRGE